MSQINCNCNKYYVYYRRRPKPYIPEKVLYENVKISLRPCVSAGEQNSSRAETRRKISYAFIFILRCAHPGMGVSRRVRKPARYRINEESLTVKDVVDRMTLCTQPVLDVRNTSRGKLKLRVLRVPVYIWNEEACMVHRYCLVATQTSGKNPETKISLSNAPETVELKTLAWMQHQRFWVERAFEDAKSECGMADYQVRKWSAWHHHMALVMMTMLFMLNERICHKDTYPMLSCSDTEEFLSHFLPRRDFRKEEIIRQLEHRKRLAAIQSHARNQELREAS
ncbi:MAG: hypothetical protein WA081_00410 [Desulfosalsimonadaceae bacterium]